MNEAKANYRVKKHFQIVPHSPDQVELRYGVWNPTAFTLTDESRAGKLFNLIRDLDGKKSVQTVAADNNVPRADVEGLVDHLLSLNVLENKSTSALDYYLEQTYAPAVNQSLLTGLQQPIILLGDEDFVEEIGRNIARSIDGLKHNLIKTEFELFRRLKQSNNDWLYDSLLLERELKNYQSWQNHFIVLALSNVDPVLAFKLNRIAYSLNISWIHAAIDGPFIFIGPTFSGTHGPCYNCFENRIAMNIREQASYQKYKQALVNAKIVAKKNVLHPIILSLAAAHLTMEILNFNFTQTNFTKGKVLSFFLPTMEIMFNEVLRLSSCHICGSVQYKDEHQLYFDYQALLGAV